MERFCPKCGTKGSRLINNLCEDCFWRERTDGIPRELKITLCSSCYAHLQGKRWVRKRDPETAAVEGAINEVQRLSELPKSTRILRIEGRIMERTAGGMPKKISLRITLVDEGASKSLEREVDVEYRLCDFCQGVSDGKYEALVQIRGKKGKLSDRGHKAVESNIEKFYRKVRERDRPDITEIKERESGIDIKFLTSSKARLFAKKLSESTGAEVKESAKIVGVDRRTGSRHYRTTISVKLPDVEVGEIISFQDKVFSIVGYHRGKFVVEDLEDSSRRTLTRRDLSNVTKIDNMNLKRVCVGPRSGRSITLLDLDEKRFFEIPAEKVSERLKEGDAGILVNLNGKERVVGQARR